MIKVAKQGGKATVFVDRVFDILNRNGGRTYLGEVVTVREHILQAAELAEQGGASEPLVVAALLHDIGHFTHEFEEDCLDHNIDSRHQHAGADFLTPYFPEAIVAPIRLHVDAKRYLCATDKNYFRHLSLASQKSLELQGGPMSKTEIAAFEQLPFADDAIKLRCFDDNAKVDGMKTKPLACYRALVMQCAR